MIRRPAADPDQDELGRTDRRNTDEADEAAGVEVVLCHRAAVAADEERLLRRRARERTVPDSFVRKSEIDDRSVVHSGSSFGSKTVHCVPRSIECSR